MTIEVKVLDPRAVLPAQGTPFSAGFDLAACIEEPLVLRYGDPAVLIPTGLAMHIGAESANLMGMLVPRSGRGHKEGLVMGLTIGIVDSDYLNQWFISAWNRGNKKDSDGNYLDIVIQPGERIAQAIFVPVAHPSFKIVQEFSTVTERGQGGFGSTGNR